MDQIDGLALLGMGRRRFPTPFAGLNSDAERRRLESEFLAFFKASVATHDEGEEQWLYDKLKQLYTDYVTRQARSDSVPSFFDAMCWAAQQPPLH